MEQYSEKVMEHFQNPRNVGEIENADGIGHVGNVVCGDIMELYIKVKDNIIVDAKFKTLGCLPPQEEVVSSDGGWERIPSISKRKSVVNSEGLETSVVETYMRRYRGAMLRIVPFVSPYNTFSLTPEHPVLCLKRERLKSARQSSSKCDWSRIDKEELLSTKPEYVKAKNLKKSDYLIFTSNRTVKDNALFNRATMRLIGYYLSEGYTPGQNSSVVAFSFNKRERNLIKELKLLILKITNKRAKERIRGNVSEVYVCSVKLARFLTAHCKKGARNKKLSREIMLLPFNKQYEMIKTYLAGDGNMYRRRPGNSHTYRIITTSKNLAIQVQEILARGGMFVSIREIFKTNCVIDGRMLKDSIQYVLAFKLERRHKFVHPHNGYFLVPIRRIEKRNFVGNVYNFQVANEPNSYLVKGFAVHNCGAAIATSSMVTELVKGKTVDEALSISNRAVAEALGGLPKIKLHCSVLAEEALKSAIEDYQKKQKVKADSLKERENPEPETVQRKAKIRERILTLLKEQEESERIAKSRSIEEKLFSLPEFIQARCVMFYVSFDGEVETTTMIKHAQQAGKKVAVPVIRANRRMGEEKLIASLLQNSDNQLIPGPYGILQPKEANILELSLEGIDLVVVPGVAFDRKGNRIGRGKGYYDRFLKDLTLKGIPLVGIAFDFQVVDNIPTLSHDLPVTELITA